MTARRWIVCSKCDRPNWENRKHDPSNCSNCGTLLPKQSGWNDAVKQAIKVRGPKICAIDFIRQNVLAIPVSPRIQKWLDRLGFCTGGVEIAHLILRHHGGSDNTPANGIALCQKHNDILLAGREIARSDYLNGEESFETWHNKLLHTSWSQLPIWIRELRIFLAGIAWSLTQCMQQSRYTRMTP